MSVLSRPVAGTDALVLRAWPCGETSAVVSLLTRDEGFVKVLAKAARRRRSNSLTNHHCRLEWREQLV